MFRRSNNEAYTTSERDREGNILQGRKTKKIIVFNVSPQFHSVLFYWAEWKWILVYQYQCLFQSRRSWANFWCSLCWCLVTSDKPNKSYFSQYHSLPHRKEELTWICVVWKNPYHFLLHFVNDESSSNILITCHPTQSCFPFFQSKWIKRYHELQLEMVFSLVIASTLMSKDFNGEFPLKLVCRLRFVLLQLKLRLMRDKYIHLVG